MEVEAKEGPLELHELEALAAAVKEYGPKWKDIERRRLIGPVGRSAK
jgi:hypothetical protein